jgi:predicted nucleic acid-binding protein
MYSTADTEQSVFYGDVHVSPLPTPDEPPTMVVVVAGEAHILVAEPERAPGSPLQPDAGVVRLGHDAELSNS